MLPTSLKALNFRKINFDDYPEYYSFASLGPLRQRFSLPRHTIYHILQYPCSSKGYRKLQKTCKYFYFKYPVIVVDNVNKDGNDNEWNLRIHNGRYGFHHINVSIAPFKIWNAKRLSIFININIPKLFKSFYRFEAKSLDIQHQNLTFDELLLFTSSPYIFEIFFINVKIEHSNGTKVAIEKIFELFPKLINFKFGFFDRNSILPITRDSVKKLTENSNFLNIKNLELKNTPETFDLVTFFEFLKVKKDANIKLFYGNNLSNNYMNQLYAFISWLFNFAKMDKSFYPLIIWFRGMDEKNLNELKQLRTNYMCSKLRT